MRERPALFLGLLADQPELIAQVGALRWRAAGSVGTPGPWIESTARTAGRDRLPLTLVATGLDGEVIGAVTLDTTADAAGESTAACAPGTPWVVRMVVRPGERRCGVGRLMASALEDLAREHGHDELWVVAADDDANFYRHCGWLDHAPATETSDVVLRKAVVPA
ncbi:MAG TPA: GNAT family N-acetyltransferase [Nocardioides sp.]|jgi:GNAT superfamily N-acetyltransferase|uniref:GNAT family N-acetyltransferase n=1 Tax=Nocardioides sp. TaxID=35761 RepID=UPI002E34D9A1|nr:GNAT family N-acetyltransferase [Nocardioides sp.]HEX3930380.1 GNAT family N-acetyltransferase [Nocardioides sp.]